MFLYDGYPSFQKPLYDDSISTISYSTNYYDVTTQASLLHEPICRYPAQERGGLYDYDFLMMDTSESSGTMSGITRLYSV